MKSVLTLRRATVTAVCIALCCVLPLALHGLPVAKYLSLMHIPVLLCGLVCGGLWGGLCGLIGPLFSSILTGMPAPLALLRMMPELAFYGMVGGLARKYLPLPNPIGKLYSSLILAMLAGRAAGGLATLAYFALTAKVYSWELFLTSYFLNALPGILCHLVLVPLLVLTLEKAKILPPLQK